MAGIIRVTNPARGTTLAERAALADTPERRIVGLLRHTGLELGEGLLITPCNSIHSIGMKFIFDAVFLDKENRVLHLIEKMKPWRVSKLVWGARSVLELPGGVIASSGTRVGDTLALNTENIDA
jgi:uncharacterized membrane protein (UPF0127 family)